jgi:hypothetical protein
MMTKSRRMSWAGHVARIEDIRNASKFSLVAELEGKRPFGRRRHRWESTIKSDLGEIDSNSAQ